MQMKGELEKEVWYDGHCGVLCITKEVHEMKERKRRTSNANPRFMMCMERNDEEVCIYVTYVY